MVNIRYRLWYLENKLKECESSRRKTMADLVNDPTFLVSGDLTVQDPCYRDDWLRNVVTKVKPGRWLAVASPMATESDRIGMLTVAHVRQPVFSDPAETFEVGVDSGQAGVFPIAPTAESSNELWTKWYDKVCDATLSSHGWGIIDENSVASSSGYGDGSYRATVYRDYAGEAVKITIEFDYFEDEDEDYEEEEDYGPASGC